jgi:hypothetical protein
VHPSVDSVSSAGRSLRTAAMNSGPVGVDDGACGGSTGLESCSTVLPQSQILDSLGSGTARAQDAGRRTHCREGGRVSTRRSRRQKDDEAVPQC